MGAIHLVSTALGILALGCHPLEFFFFMVFRMWETVDVHCGYALPFTPFRTEMHDYHHMRVNGCYGSFFMDDLMGKKKSNKVILITTYPHYKFKAKNCESKICVNLKY